MDEPTAQLGAAGDGPMILFRDDEGNAMLVARGAIDPYTMADRAYLTLAGALGGELLDTRLQAGVLAGASPLHALIDRVRWCALRTDDDHAYLVAHGGEPVTTIDLHGVVAIDEIADFGDR